MVASGARPAGVGSCWGKLVDDAMVAGAVMVSRKVSATGGSGFVLAGATRKPAPALGIDLATMFMTMFLGGIW